MAYKALRALTPTFLSRLTAGLPPHSHPSARPAMCARKDSRLLPSACYGASQCHLSCIVFLTGNSPSLLRERFFLIHTPYFPDVVPKISVVLLGYLKGPGVDTQVGLA